MQTEFQHPNFNALVDDLMATFMRAATTPMLDLRSALAEALANAGILPAGCGDDEDSLGSA